MDNIEINATIIGGGIIGLLTAYELKKKFPAWEIALIEAAPFLGDHSTGRNSGVLHAGLYYPTNSHKHLLCIEGLHLWKHKLSQELGIDLKECGKVVFAKNANEESGLEDIWIKANQNGVEGLSRLSEKKLQEINAFVEAKAAFFSPHTGIIDVTGALKKITNAFENLGGMIAKNCQVNHIEKNDKFKLKTSHYNITSDFVINAAGFFGTSIREHLGLSGIANSLVKGNYISTSQKLEHPHLFYPVPPKDLKGLGVHSTLDMDGKIKFGPNTEDVSAVDYSDTQSALKLMAPEITNIFKGIDASKLYWDYAGIRSKIINTENGKLETDFWIKSPIPGYIECLGIESPGLTSAPAIVKKILNDFIP
ncbi:MAG: FAD-dependent oxidoreductase [Bdellovibrionales bacterium]|nr:FAD-dependent oxidoreductase [Bdellovibrionales bacterium]